MKQLVKVCLLYFVYEFKDGHEDTILLGVFSSKKKAKDTLLKLKNSIELKSFQKLFIIDENKINRISWEEGYTTISY